MNPRQSKLSLPNSRILTSHIDYLHTEVVPVTLFIPVPLPGRLQRRSVRRRHRGHWLPRPYPTVLAPGWAPLVWVTRPHRSNPPEATLTDPTDTPPYPPRMPVTSPCAADRARAAIGRAGLAADRPQRLLHLLCLLADDGKRHSSPVPREVTLLSARFAPRRHTGGACDARRREARDGVPRAGGMLARQGCAQ